jgi:ATP-dependent Lon protease
VTGSIGDVMRESAEAALSYIRSHAEEIGIGDIDFDELDIHLHIPAGAQPKDGPSAGITIAAALTSLLVDKPISSEIGMTGEITLRGKILSVGGIKEKMLAAHRAGLKKVYMPSENMQDLDDLPEEIMKEIEFKAIDTIQDLIKEIL